MVLSRSIFLTSLGTPQALTLFLRLHWLTLLIAISNFLTLLSEEIPLVHKRAFLSWQSFLN